MSHEVNPLDRTYTLANGKPYTVRDITIDEFEEFITIGTDFNAVNPRSRAQAIRNQMAFVLEDGDGVQPEPSETGSLRMRDWSEIINAVAQVFQ